MTPRPRLTAERYARLYAAKRAELVKERSEQEPERRERHMRESQEFRQQG